VETFESLGKINSKTVLAALVGRREQADEVEVESSISALQIVSTCHIFFLIVTHLGIIGNSKSVVAVGSILVRSKHKLMLNPLLLIGLGLDLDAAKDIVGNVRSQGSSKVALVSTLDPERASVLLLLDIHSPVALVEETNLLALALSRLDVHRDGESVGERSVETVEGELSIVDGSPTRQRNRVFLAVLESTVADEFSVDAAITGVVNILAPSQYTNHLQ
jgi:hypothetical protein